ncbi:uncharacterized protein [Argopecten irradians]|uniref:uncharacterized protein n=1 Tax=Argopecten irradians TaxID=31199 RepID=UPI00371391B6
MNPISRGHPINRPPLLQHSREPWPRPSSGAHMHELDDNAPFDAYAHYRKHVQEVGSHGQQNKSTSQNLPRVRKSRWSSAPGDTVSQSYQPQYPTRNQQIYLSGTDPYPPGTEPCPPGTEPCPPGTEPYPPGTEPCPPGTEPYPPGTEPYPPGTEPYPPGTEPYPPGTEPYPPGTEPYPGENSTGSHNSSSGGLETSQGPQSSSVNYTKRKREEDHSNPPAGTVTKKVKRFCGVCNIQFINAEALVNHEKGLMHQQKVKDLEESKKKVEEKKIKKEVEEDDADVEEDDADDDDDEDTSYCKYCNQSFNNPESFYKHTRGMLHTQNLMAAESKKTQQVATKPGPFTTVSMPSAKEETKHIQFFPSPKRVDQEEDNWMELCLEEEEKEKIPLEERDLAPSDIVTKSDHLLHCEICNVTCSGEQPMRQHLEGNKHRSKAHKLNADVNAGVVSKKGGNETGIKLVEVSSEALATKTLARSDVAMIGLQYITEFQPEEGHPRYVCNLCESKCDISTLLTHVGGVKHRMKYLKHHHKDIYYHLTAYNNIKKKSELNAACETFASDIVEKYGQEKVRVKIEISQRSFQAAEAILKTSGVSVTDRNLMDFLISKKELGNVHEVPDQDGKVSISAATKAWPTKQGKSKNSGKPVVPKVRHTYESEESDTSEYSEEYLAMQRLGDKDGDDMDAAENPYLKERRRLGHDNSDEMDPYLRAHRRRDHDDSNDSDPVEDPYFKARRRLDHENSDDMDHAEDPYLRARRRLGHDDSDNLNYAGDPYLRAGRRKDHNEYDSDDSRTFNKDRQVFDYEHRDRSASPGQVQVFEYGNKSVQKQVFDYDNKSLGSGGKQVFEYGNKSMRAGEKKIFEYENKPLKHKEIPAFDYGKKSSRQRKVDDFDYSDSTRKQQKRSMLGYDDSEEMWDHDYRDQSVVSKFRKKEPDVDLRKDPAKVKKKPLLDVDDRQTSSKVVEKTSAKEKKASIKSEREIEETEDDFGESERLFKEFMKWRKAASKSSSEEDTTSTVEGTKSTAAHQTATSTVQTSRDTTTITAKSKVPAAPHQIIQTMENQAMPGVPGHHVPSVQIPGQPLYQTPPPGHHPASQQTQPLVQQIQPGQSQHHAPPPSRAQQIPPGQSQHHAPPPSRAQQIPPGQSQHHAPPPSWAQQIPPGQSQHHAPPPSWAQQIPPGQSQHHAPPPSRAQQIPPGQSQHHAPPPSRAQQITPGQSQHHAPPPSRAQQIPPGQSQQHAPPPSRAQPPVSASNQQLAPQHVPLPSNKSNQPGKSILKNTKEAEAVPKKINEMLGALSQTLIKSEDEAAMALQVSNALTQALLKFRLMKAPVQKGKSGTGDSQSEAIKEQNKMINQLTQHHMQSMVKEESVHKTTSKSSVSSAPGKVPAPHTGPVHSQSGLIPPVTGHAQPQHGLVHPITGHSQSQHGLIPPVTGHSHSQHGLIPPVTGHSQSQPGLIPPVTWHSQSQPGLIPPVTWHSQSQPGLIPHVTGHSQSQPGLIPHVTGHSQSQPGLIHPMTGSDGMVQNVPYTQTMAGNIPQGPAQQKQVPLGAQQFNAYSLKGKRGEVKEKEMEAWKESMRNQALAQTYIQPPLPEEMPPPPPPPPPHQKKPLLPLPKSSSQKQGFHGPIRMKVANVQKKDKPLIQNHHPHFRQPKS